MQNYTTTDLMTIVFPLIRDAAINDYLYHIIMQNDRAIHFYNAFERTYYNKARTMTDVKKVTVGGSWKNKSMLLTSIEEDMH